MFGKQYTSSNMMPLKVDISGSMHELQSPTTTKASINTNIAISQCNDFLFDKKEALLRLELLAIVGLPPGLTNEAQLSNLPEAKRGGNHGGDQSTACSTSSRTSSPGASYPSASDTIYVEKTFDNTTVMIRNIVGHCTRKMLLDFMDRHGFKATKFQTLMNGFKEVALFGDNVAETSWSQCQGLAANVEKFRNSTVMHPSVEEECRPLLFKNGKVVSFPKPTRTLKLDRRNRRDAHGCDGA